MALAFKSNLVKCSAFAQKRGWAYTKEVTKEGAARGGASASTSSTASSTWLRV